MPRIAIILLCLWFKAMQLTATLGGYGPDRSSPILWYPHF